MSFIDSCHFCYLVKCNLYLFATVVLLLIWVCNFLYTVPVHYIVFFILIWDEFIKMDNNTRCLKKVYSESSGGIQFSRKNLFLFLSFHFFFPSWSRKNFDFTSIEIVNRFGVGDALDYYWFSCQILFSRLISCCLSSNAICFVAVVVFPPMAWIHISVVRVNLYCLVGQFLQQKIIIDFFFLALSVQRIN